MLLSMLIFTHLYSLKIMYNRKVIAYLRTLRISHCIDAINKPSCVSLKIQMGRNHKTTDMQ